MPGISYDTDFEVAHLAVTSLSQTILPSSTQWLHCPSPFHPPTSTLFACSMLLRTHHHSHTSLYIPCTAVNGSLFGFFTIEDGTDRSFWNVGKELALLTKLFLKLLHNSSFILQRWHLRWYWDFYFDFHVYMTHGSRWCTPDIIIVTICTLVALKLGLR
jgi:hypothetical protein